MPRLSSPTARHALAAFAPAPFPVGKQPLLGRGMSCLEFPKRCNRIYLVDRDRVRPAKQPAVDSGCGRGVIIDQTISHLIDKQSDPRREVAIARVDGANVFAVDDPVRKDADEASIQDVLSADEARDGRDPCAGKHRSMCHHYRVRPEPSRSFERTAVRSFSELAASMRSQPRESPCSLSSARFSGSQSLRSSKTDCCTLHLSRGWSHGLHIR